MAWRRRFGSTVTMEPRIAAFSVSVTGEGVSWVRRSAMALVRRRESAESLGEGRWRGQESRWMEKRERAKAVARICEAAPCVV